MPFGTIDMQICDVVTMVMMSVNLEWPTTVCDTALRNEMGDAEFAITAYGVRPRFRVPDALLDVLPSPIVPGADLDDRGPADAMISVQVNHSVEGETLYEVTENGMILGIETSLQAAACRVESWAQLTLATLAKELVFVHAGVVGWRNRALVIPGRSFSGKSTLVMALVEAGADYYSDEYAIFDLEGKVHPYWRLPKLRSASGHKVASRLLGGVFEWSASHADPLGMGSDEPFRSGELLATPAADLRGDAVGAVG